jgi:hypothetical protein
MVKASATIERSLSDLADTAVCGLPFLLPAHCYPSVYLIGLQTAIKIRDPKGLVNTMLNPPYE